MRYRQMVVARLHVQQGRIMTAAQLNVNCAPQNTAVTASHATPVNALAANRAHYYQAMANHAQPLAQPALTFTTANA